MPERIEKALQEIRPMLFFHKGDIEFVNFEEGIVYVRFLGNCKGCPLADLTLKMGVEELLKKRIPEVKSVEAV